MPKPETYILTPEREQILRGYQGRHGEVTHLARRLGVEAWCVYKWLRQVGWEARDYHHWTKEECRYLCEHIGFQTYKELAEHFSVSVVAVYTKAKKLGYQKHGEGYRLHDLTIGFGCNKATVQRWIEKGWLQGQQGYTDQAEGGKGFWHFTDQEVRRFLLRYPQAIAHLKFDYLWVHDLLVGGTHGTGRLSQDGDR